MNLSVFVRVVLVCLRGEAPTKRVRSKAPPENAGDPPGSKHSLGDLKKKFPDLVANVEHHINAYKAGDKSEKNMAGMKDAIRALEKAKGSGKGCDKTKVKIEPKETVLYEGSSNPIEAPTQETLRDATRKRLRKHQDAAGEGDENHTTMAGKGKGTSRATEERGEGGGSDKPKKRKTAFKTADIDDKEKEKRHVTFDPAVEPSLETQANDDKEEADDKDDKEEADDKEVDDEEHGGDEDDGKEGDDCKEGDGCEEQDGKAGGGKGGDKENEVDGGKGSGGKTDRGTTNADGKQPNVEKGGRQMQLKEMPAAVWTPRGKGWV